MTGRRRWPLLVIGASAGVAVWSGWVGLGGMTGFGEVRPLPGIWDGLTIDTAITLPIGVEAYGIYALSVATDPADLPARVRRVAWASAGAALGLGAGAQVAYHLMAAHGVTQAPWWVIAAVAVLPVAVLGAASLLWHLRAAAESGAEAAAEAAAGQPVEVTAPARERRPVTGQVSGQPAAPVMPAGGAPVMPASVTVTRPERAPVTRSGGTRAPVTVDDLVLPAQAVARELVRSGQKVTRASLAEGLRARGHACSTDKAQALMPRVRELLEQSA